MANLVVILRSILFNSLFFIWTLGLGVVVVIPGLIGPRLWVQRSASIWSRGVFLLLRIVVGLYHNVRGLENIPAGPVIIAAKHQSAWDTLLFHTILDDPIFVAKRELFFIPVVGWLMYRSGCIGINRSNGVQALKRMVRKAQEAASNGSQLIIFPEGTRTLPGISSSYQPGVVMLYRALSIPVVPVALNSGLFWGRRSFIKRPGRIIVEFLHPILPINCERHAFIIELKSRIELATRQLEKRF